MYDAAYYREQSDHAKHLSRKTIDREVSELLARVARDYAEIAADLEVGAVEIRHREMMPRMRHAAND